MGDLHGRVALLPREGVAVFGQAQSEEPEKIAAAFCSGVFRNCPLWGPPCAERSGLLRIGVQLIASDEAKRQTDLDAIASGVRCAALSLAHSPVRFVAGTTLESPISLARGQYEGMRGNMRESEGNANRRTENVISTRCGYVRHFRLELLTLFGPLKKTVACARIDEERHCERLWAGQMLAAVNSGRI